MAASRILLIGATAFAGGYLVNRAVRKTASNKVVTCFITNYLASAFNRAIKEDDVVEWIEKAAPGGEKKGFVIHFHGDSPVGKVAYSEDHTVAKARVGLLLTQSGIPRKFTYSVRSIEGKTHGDEVTYDSHIHPCDGCPP